MVCVDSYEVNEQEREKALKKALIQTSQTPNNGMKQTYAKWKPTHICNLEKWLEKYAIFLPPLL